jgi:pyruvate dehydrogenase E1 component alpha subunit/2-oxoisovalerate dehydrogenase E1 component alpha subunit
MDERLLALQRQGRIGFYGTCKGQEAATVGSGAALEREDWAFPALREGAVLLMRGFPLERYVAQLMGCALDPTHGRQMPCHFSSAEHHYVSLSSVIATQIPQAMGAPGRPSRAQTVVLATSATHDVGPTSTAR